MTGDLTPEQLWLASRPDSPYRVLGTGSQTWDDSIVVRDTLALVWHPAAVLVLGACPRGGDRLMEDCWTHWGGHVELHPADWVGPCQLDCPGGHRRTNSRGGDYCPRAGMVRNLRMVHLGGSGVCLAHSRRFSRRVAVHGLGTCCWDTRHRTDGTSSERCGS